MLFPRSWRTESALALNRGTTTHGQRPWHRARTSPWCACRPYRSENAVAPSKAISTMARERAGASLYRHWSHQGAMSTKARWRGRLYLLSFALQIIDKFLLLSSLHHQPLTPLQSNPSSEIQFLYFKVRDVPVPVSSGHCLQVLPLSSPCRLPIGTPVLVSIADPHWQGHFQLQVGVIRGVQPVLAQTGGVFSIVRDLSFVNSVNSRFVAISL